MTGELGQTVIVENRPGAAGTVGSATVARAAPDGYTLLIGSLGATVITPIAKKDVPYDPRTAFTPIASITSQPLILIVPESSPYKTLADLVAAGRQRSGKLNYATAGIGSVSNFASEQFNKTLGTDFVHVPYAGSAPALRALMAGEVAMYFSAASDAVARLKGGSVRGLLVTLPKRVPSAPDVPSLGDAGLKDPYVDMWFGLVGPAGLAPDVVTKLNAAVQVALKDPALQQALVGSEITPGTPEDFAATLKASLEIVARQVRETGFRIE
jgi:tripartite-type tricarboxylate transporter receptor subunit TctC